MNKKKISDDFTEDGEVSKMFLDEDIKVLDELAFYCNKFNLDFDTVETMPAFKDHLKPLVDKVETQKASLLDSDEE